VIKLVNIVCQEGSMATQEDIQKIENHLIDVENYIEKGLLTPDQNLECAKKLTDIDITLDQLHIISSKEYVAVSKLMKRFVQAKNKLPSQP